MKDTASPLRSVYRLREPCTQITIKYITSGVGAAVADVLVGRHSYISRSASWGHVRGEPWRPERQSRAGQTEQGSDRYNKDSGKSWAAFSL